MERKYDYSQARKKIPEICMHDYFKCSYCGGCILVDQKGNPPRDDNDKIWCGSCTGYSVSKDYAYTEVVKDYDHYK